MEATYRDRDPSRVDQSQEKYTGKVEKISLAGALIDIVVDQPAVLHISQVLPLENGEPVRLLVTR